MRRFTEQWPEIDVTLVELEDDEITVAVERGEIDVGFVLLPVGDHPLETVELLRDPYVLIVPADSPLADADAVARATSSSEPLVGFRECTAVEPIEAAFRAEGSSRTGRSGRTTTRPCRRSSPRVSASRSCRG